MRTGQLGCCGVDQGEVIGRDAHPEVVGRRRQPGPLVVGQRQPGLDLLQRADAVAQLPAPVIGIDVLRLAHHGQPGPHRQAGHRAHIPGPCGVAGRGAFIGRQALGLAPRHRPAGGRSRPGAGSSAATGRCRTPGIWLRPAMITCSICSGAAARKIGSAKSRMVGMVFFISASPRPSAPWQRAHIWPYICSTFTGTAGPARLGASQPAASAASSTDNDRDLATARQRHRGPVDLATLVAELLRLLGQPGGQRLVDARCPSRRRSRARPG